MTTSPTDQNFQKAPDNALAVIKRLMAGFYWLFMAIIGLILLVNLALGGLFMYRTHQFLNRAARTEATVIRMVPNSPDTAMVAPVMEYLDADQKTHEFQSSVYSNPPSYHVGEKIGIYYDPADPYDARVDSFFSLWLLPFIFGVVASILIFILIVASILALILRWAFRAADHSSATAVG